MEIHAFAFAKGNPRAGRDMGHLFLQKSWKDGEYENVKHFVCDKGHALTGDFSSLSVLDYEGNILAITDSGYVAAGRTAAAYRGVHCKGRDVEEEAKRNDVPVNIVIADVVKMLRESTKEKIDMNKENLDTIEYTFQEDGLLEYYKRFSDEFSKLDDFSKNSIRQILGLFDYYRHDRENKQKYYWCGLGSLSEAYFKTLTKAAPLTFILLPENEITNYLNIFSGYDWNISQRGITISPYRKPSSDAYMDTREVKIHRFEIRKDIDIIEIIKKNENVKQLQKEIISALAVQRQ